MEFYMEDACIDRLLAPYRSFENEDPLLLDEIPCPYRPQRTAKPTTAQAIAPKRRRGKRV